MKQGKDISYTIFYTNLDINFSTYNICTQMNFPQEKSINLLFKKTSTFSPCHNFSVTQLIIHFSKKQYLIITKSSQSIKLNQVEENVFHSRKNVQDNRFYSFVKGVNKFNRKLTIHEFEAIYFISLLIVRI